MTNESEDEYAAADEDGVEVDESEEDLYEDSDYDRVYFEGDCTCEHDRNDHGWGQCNEEGCECEAGWVE